jgi:hypothetical protein
MRMIIRTSRLAIWARRFASLAVPLILMPVLLHRARLIATQTFEVVEIAALVSAGVAFLLSLLSFVRIWNTGDRGGSLAVFAFIVSLVCLAPFGYAGYLMQSFPHVLDVSTDPVDQMVMVSDALVGVEPDASEADAVAIAFPNARTREYPLDAPQLYLLVQNLITERGWAVLEEREPIGSMGVGQINAVDTRLLGARDEVAIRITGDAAGARVDMRSAALGGRYDYGANGTRIEAFLAALDNQVALLLRDSPSAADPDPDEEAEPAPEDAATG